MSFAARPPPIRAAKDSGVCPPLSHSFVTILHSHHHHHHYHHHHHHRLPLLTRDDPRTHLELIELRRETMADAGRCFSDPMLFEAGILGGAALALLKLDPPMPTTLKKPSSPPPSLSPLLFVAHKGGHTPLSLAALIGGGLAANDMPFAPPPPLYPACPCPPPPSPLPNKIAQTLRDNTSFSQPDDVNLDLC